MSPKHIPLQPCTSSRLCATGYDPATNVLALQFKGRDGAPGPVYHYSNVTPEIHAQFTEAESKGKFFGSVLSDRAKFPYVRIEDAYAKLAADRGAEQAKA